MFTTRNGWLRSTPFSSPSDLCGLCGSAVNLSLRKAQPATEAQASRRPARVMKSQTVSTPVPVFRLVKTKGFVPRILRLQTVGTRWLRSSAHELAERSLSLNRRAAEAAEIRTRFLGRAGGEVRCCSRRETAGSAQTPFSSPSDLCGLCGSAVNLSLRKAQPATEAQASRRPARVMKSQTVSTPVPVFRLVKTKGFVPRILRLQTVGTRWLRSSAHELAERSLSLNRRAAEAAEIRTRFLGSRGGRGSMMFTTRNGWLRSTPFSSPSDLCGLCGSAVNLSLRKAQPATEAQASRRPGRVMKSQTVS